MPHSSKGGQNHLICVDSLDRESFYNDHGHPRIRILRQRQYEQYVLQEVLPFVRHRTGHDFIIAAGASFGAYHATNFVCKQPWAFGKLIALSGAFDIRSFMDGYYDDDVYFSNPVDYLPGLELSAMGIQLGEILIAVDRAQFVSNLEIGVSPGERSLRHRNGLWGNGVEGLGLERHGGQRLETVKFPPVTPI